MQKILWVNIKWENQWNIFTEDVGEKGTEKTWSGQGTMAQQGNALPAVPTPNPGCSTAELALCIWPLKTVEDEMKFQ